MRGELFFIVSIFANYFNKIEIYLRYINLTEIALRDHTYALRKYVKI